MSHLIIVIIISIILIYEHALRINGAQTGTFTPLQFFAHLFPEKKKVLKMMNILFTIYFLVPLMSEVVFNFDDLQGLLISSSLSFSCSFLSYGRD